MSPHSFFQTVKIIDNVSKMSSCSIYSCKTTVSWSLWPSFSFYDLMRHSREVIIKAFESIRIELGWLWLHVLCSPSELPWWCWHLLLCPLSRLLFFLTAKQISGALASSLCLLSLWQQKSVDCEFRVYSTTNCSFWGQSTFSNILICSYSVFHWF